MLPEEPGQTVSVEIQDAVAIVTLDRPDAQNAFNTALRGDLSQAIRAVEENTAVRAVVLTGRGRNFSAGADLNDRDRKDPSVERMLNEEYTPMLLAIMRSAKPWVGAINGAAAGIGSSFALACDLSVMGESACLYQAFVAIGLIPDGGASWHLVRTLGFKRAFEMMIAGERISAERCLALGLTNRVVPDALLLDQGLALARQLAVKAPLAVARTKAAVRFSADHPIEAVMPFEARLQQACTDSEDFKEGVAAFRAKRAATFLGL
ncbi:enoyl-CoA hydratase-related protein [Sphingobium sp. JS3065]|uniref:enoyl-CoA hydratase/isomerase family protein n=1 Tax=Sphingobium sp. JS3065 TaxID=2970925 RepID=UPI0022655170|nr:enoyl-CoA hydratase-related protein [Sphingobium sp. JS3065]UZW55998.1 enoyl-CoA hydratase-related protein [Sphingobium sp. JS3065]